MTLNEAIDLRQQIEKGVPIPPHRISTGRRPKIPYFAMEVGDSIVTQDEVRASNYCKDGKAFVCLQVQENGTTHFRTWRTA
jgi:hypothetical protein